MDDYHQVDERPVGEVLAQLLDHQPPQLHLIIASRQDPALPLARLRARQQLIELRAADLRFTFAESAEFLNRAMHLNLSLNDVRALESRTEGWAAGLQLAALSLQGRDDVAQRIADFAGSHRFVLDYLVNEVLGQQSGSVRDFLLQTSILERLCPSLCDAVTGRGDSLTVLAGLERANLFLVPLDDRRQWYRFHPLFAEVLQAQLHETRARDIAALHQRACAWFERNELAPEAVRHALAARDFDLAADLLEDIWLSMNVNHQSGLWMSWVTALPEDLVRARPGISVGYAWALLSAGRLEESEARLLNAERRLLDWTGDRTSGRLGAKPAACQDLQISIAAARAYRAMALGDLDGTRAHAGQALALSSCPDSLFRTRAMAMLGFAEYASGNLAEAEHQLLEFQNSMWQVHDLASAIGITFILADIKRVQGRLRDAIATYVQSLELADRLHAPAFLGASDLHRGLGELFCEQGDLDAAARHLAMAQRLGEQGALTGWPQRLYVARARLRELQGDPAGALTFLEEAERVVVRNPLPTRSIVALQARMLVRLGRWKDALHRMHARGLTPHDPPAYVHEFEYLVLARVLTARYGADPVEGERQDIVDLLDRLLTAASEGGRTGSVIEILVQQALTLQVCGDGLGALEALSRAVDLAEPEGYQRVFLDEGAAMRSRIRSLAQARGHPPGSYVCRLLAAFAQAVDRPRDCRLDWNTELPEPLSEREVEVLRLLRSDLSGPEIARRLVVSLNTFRTHTKSIFAKLGVNNRRAAVRRADEIHLV
ncbi:MAG TPA: LuxR C-terminal-related transcriptional regulator [Anaerolineales bacterium]|nr:LuxR C-terminal-related transcriptional regulator [Anaerolineales bacterium]